MMRSIIGIWESGGPFGLQLRKSVGRVLSNMVYFRLSNPITLSTCILTFAIPLDFSTSTGSNWDFPLVKAGITSLPCLRPTLSEIVKPLSAITVSPGKTLSKKNTVLSQMFIRSASTSSFRHKTHCSLWCYAYQDLYGVVVFV